MKTCKYKHKIISPFSSRHLGWIPLLMWTKTTLYFTPFTISILFFQTPALNVVFRFVYFYFAFFQVFSLFPPGPNCWTFSRTHTSAHLWPVWRAFPSTHTNPPQTICLICFVFSNELDVKFNTHTLTHSYAKEKLRWTFPFWIFRLAIEKAAKKSKSVTKEKYYFFHDNRERRRRWSSSSVKKQEASAD